MALETPVKWKRVGCDAFICTPGGFTWARNLSLPQRRSIYLGKVRGCYTAWGFIWARYGTVVHHEALSGLGTGLLYSMGLYLGKVRGCFTE